MPTTPMAEIEATDSAFEIRVPTSLRSQPELEFTHRLQTRDHLSYLKNEKLFDVNDSRWGKKIVDGKTVYFHKFQGCILLATLEHPKFKLNDSDNTLFDQHLKSNPGEITVFSLTSQNNGIESSHTITLSTVGLASIPIILAGIVLTYNLATGVAAAADAAAIAEAAALVEEEIVEAVGMPLRLSIPGIGIILSILALIGIWVAYLIGRNIILNVIYENRSSKTITLVDHSVWNIGDKKLNNAVLKPVKTVNGIDYYTDVVIDVANDSKYMGVGLSLKFEKEDKTHLIICIRNDIYKQPYYSIAVSEDTAEQFYNKCNSQLDKKDFEWGKDLIVKNNLDADGFQHYNFNGIISFHDPAVKA